MSIRWSGIQSWYHVKYLDGDTVDVQVRVPDALRWERNNQGKSLLSNQSITSMLECVWYALRREGLSDVKAFETWSALVDDFGQMDGPEADEPVDPTSPDQSAG